MGRAAIIVLLGGIALLSTLSLNFQSKTTEARRRAAGFHADNQSRNICNSMIGMLMSKLATNSQYRVKTSQTRDLLNGAAIYTIKDTLLPATSDSIIEIAVSGIYFGDTTNAIVYVNEPSATGFVPSPVKAAITTNNPVETSGNLTVDGRDHDISANLISNNGTLGIWTTSSINQKGNSKIGSTNDAGVDFAPAKKVSGNSDYVLYNQTWPGGYPDSPDKLLGGPSEGYPEGTLKSIAQSGANGSQYVSNPAFLSYPLSGVTYVELTSGDEWKPANIQGSGILIIHNSSTNAIIKNLNGGTFKGLLIADDIIHIHTTIIGAVVGLSPFPSSGNCIGNGTGDVLFSRQAIKDATAMTSSGAGGYGYARQRMEVIYWYE